jgi:general secretion pathway protein B
MSFILDALKKSENARQRQIGPAMAELPRRRRQSERPWWAFVVAGLLLVNVGVLILVLTRNKDDIKPVSDAAAAPIAAAPITSRNIAAARTGSLSSLADEAAMPGELDGDSELSNPAAAVSQPQVVRPIQAPSVTPLATPAPAATSKAAAPPAAPPAAPVSNATTNEVLPTVGELTASGRTFPVMRLDIHVFGETPAERFVFVNMRKYAEGQVLQEGPTVERITADGVILNQQGLRFILPRQ